MTRPKTRAARLADLTRTAGRVRSWTDRRDDAIRALVADGVPGREVARAAGMTHTAVQYIVAKGAAADGVPPRVIDAVARRAAT